MTGIDGLACTWDVLDRLVAVEDGRLRAEYAYDYTGRRIWKRVWQKDAEGNTGTFPATTTTYVGRHFEIREYDQPTKVVFAGDTRVATVTGTLNGDPHRTQRLRLFAGWNLLALAVSLSTSAPLFAVASAAFLWDPDGGGYLPVGPGDPLAAGAVLWVHCETPVTLALAGPYVEPGSYPVPAGASFVSGPPLAAWQADAALPAATRTWRFDPVAQRWEVKVPAELGFLSGFPAFIRPGEPVFVVSSDPSGFILQPSSLRILYYHQDHLGSSAIIADAAGNVVDETAYYPYGYPRHHDRPEAARAVLPTRYGFTQKEQDEETGLHYFEARYLVAALGRFASVDPVCQTSSSARAGAPGMAMPYAHAASNPLRFADPGGTRPREVDLMVMLYGAADEASTQSHIEEAERIFREEGVDIRLRARFVQAEPLMTSADAEDPAAEKRIEAAQRGIEAKGYPTQGSGPMLFGRIVSARARPGEVGVFFVPKLDESDVHGYTVRAGSALGRGVGLKRSYVMVGAGAKDPAETLAHELGHVLLRTGEHEADPFNLMAAGSQRLGRRAVKAGRAYFGRAPPRLTPMQREMIEQHGRFETLTAAPRELRDQ